MSLDSAVLAEQMLGAGAAAFGEHWNTAKGFAEGEFRTLAMRLETIGEQVANGLDHELARILVEAQKRTAIQIIAGATMLTILAVEAAINAVLAVIRDTVNTTLGFALL